MTSLPSRALGWAGLTLRAVLVAIVVAIVVSVVAAVFMGGSGTRLIWTAPIGTFAYGLACAGMGGATGGERRSRAALMAGFAGTIIAVIPMTLLAILLFSTDNLFGRFVGIIVILAAILSLLSAAVGTLVGWLVFALTDGR